MKACNDSTAASTGNYSQITIRTQDNHTATGEYGDKHPVVHNLDIYVGRVSAQNLITTVNPLATQPLVSRTLHTSLESTGLNFTIPGTHPTSIPSVVSPG